MHLKQQPFTASFDLLQLNIYSIHHPNVRKKANIVNSINQLPHLTQNIILKSDKNTRKEYIQESQEVSPFQAGDQKATRKKKIV